MAEPSPEQFPRSKDLPTQSPLFWVEQKDRYLRQLLIRDIEEQTGRRFIAYFANRYQNAQIDARDPAYMAELLGDLKGAPFDLLIETGGGFTDSTEALVSLIQKSCSDFRAVVAHAAKSNGTLLCLAAKSIIMGAPSQLGPIDPHLNGIPATILVNPAFTGNFILQQQAIYALNQTKKLAESLLASGMCAGRTPDQIKELVQKISSRDVYFSHGSVIDHVEAKALGLHVDYLEPGDALWQRIWFLHCMYDFDCRSAGLLKIFEGRRISTAIAAPPPQPAPPKPGP